MYENTFRKALCAAQNLNRLIMVNKLFLHNCQIMFHIVQYYSNDFDDENTITSGIYNPFTYK